MKPQYIIAIDPDVDRNGVAILYTTTKRLGTMTYNFPELLEYLLATKRTMEASGNSYRVLIEAGWLNQGNFHLNPRDSKAVIAAKGNAAGRNHEVGRKIAEMCDHWHIPHELVKPLVKCWSGHDRKITAKELQAITGLQGKTNQETRDAALIAWVWAGYPIRIKQTKK